MKRLSVLALFAGFFYIFILWFQPAGFQPGCPWAAAAESGDNLSELPFIGIPGHSSSPPVEKEREAGGAEASVEGSVSEAGKPEDEPALRETPPEPSVSASQSDWLENDSASAARAEKLRRQIMRTLLALVIVGVLIFLVIRWLAGSKLNLSFLGIGVQSSKIKVLDRHLLQPHKVLYLIRTGSKCFLIGVSEKQIDYLTDVDPDSLEQDTAPGKESGGGSSSPFEMFAKVDAGKSDT